MRNRIHKVGLQVLFAVMTLLVSGAKVHALQMIKPRGICSDSDSDGHSLYRQLAAQTGGQAFDLSNADPMSRAKVMALAMPGFGADVLSIVDTLAGAPKAYSFPVDSSMARLKISVTGNSSVVLERPDGSAVAADDPGVESVSTPTVAMFVIAKPALGTWKVTVDGRGEFSLAVSGKSDLDFISFDFVEPGGRPGHGGLFDTAGFPLAGVESFVEAELDEEIQTAQFEFRTQSGAVIKAFELVPLPDDPGEFFGKVTTPKTPFRVYVTGLDAEGHAYQRHQPGLISPQTFRVVKPAREDLRRGQNTAYVFRVENRGPSDGFEVCAVDSQGFLTNVTPASFVLDTGQAIEVTAQLYPPIDAPLKSNELTITVRRVSTGGTNFAVFRSLVLSE